LQGVYVKNRRPKSKKEVKEATAENPENVVLEATSIHGNEWGGPLDQAPEGTYTFVGPDPYTSRKFYGTIKVSKGKITVS
jgi:hypothetical protein